MHICFGYAAIIHAQTFRLFVPAGACGLSLPSGFGRDGAVEPGLRTLEALRGKKIMLGVIDLSDPKVETRRAGGARGSGARCRTSAPRT